jgi:hypothetical protein
MGEKKMTKAAELIKSLTELQEMVGEEMTQHSTETGIPQDFPSEFKGMVKVVNVKDQSAKKFLGQNWMFYVDAAKGETDLMVPGEPNASLNTVKGWFDLEVVKDTPNN